MCSNKADERFLSLFFFQNGLCFKPEKFRVRKSDFDRYFRKEGNLFYYKGKGIYTTSGESLKSLTKLADNSAYVLVKPNEEFRPNNYSQYFNDFLKKTTLSSMDHQSSCPRKSRGDFRKCQSTPAVGCRKCSQHSVKFSPCTNDCPSEASNDCQESHKRSKKEPQNTNPKAKKGFFGKCCPCCVKARPSICPSNPMIECGNGKMTQTTPEDFKCSIARLKRAVSEEKKRKKLYGSMGNPRRKDSDNRPPYCPPCNGVEPGLCEDPKVVKKIQNERMKYHQKRQAMEQRIGKALDRKYAKLMKSETC